MSKDKKKALRKIKDRMVHALNDLTKEIEDAEGRKEAPQLDALQKAHKSIKEGIKQINSATIEM